MRHFDKFRWIRHIFFWFFWRYTYQSWKNNAVFLLASSAELVVSYIKMKYTKSLERSPSVGDFYGTGIEILAGFGPVGITEKKTFGPIMSNFWGRFFKFSRVEKKIKNIVTSALKSFIKWSPIIFSWKIRKKNNYRIRNVFNCGTYLLWLWLNISSMQWPKIS